MVIFSDTVRPDEQRRASIRSVADLGQLVRLVRKERRMTQQELADMAGVGRRFLLELEAGKTSVEFGRALQVTAALGIDLSARTR